MKTCTRCHETKMESEFQIRKASKDGLTAACKSCLSNQDKQRNNLPHRVKMRRDYSRTIEGKSAHARACKKYRENNPEKRKAHNAVNNALRDGRLERQPCEVCDSTDVHAHHDDYSKPLEVRWLCPVHHKELHSCPYL